MQHGGSMYEAKFKSVVWLVLQLVVAMEVLVLVVIQVTGQ